jgi:hypothetical protein
MFSTLSITGHKKQLFMVLYNVFLRVCGLLFPLPPLVRNCFREEIKPQKNPE